MSLSAQIKIPKLQRAEEFNFVPNPSFEVTKDIPCQWNQGLGKFQKWFIDWNSPTETTPDIISTASKSTCWSHPAKNNGGKQFPKSGINMIGMKLYGKGGTDTFWHEYIQVKLKEPLKEDTLYYAEFWVNLSAKASKAVDNIGLAVSSEETLTRDRLPIYLTPEINANKIINPRFFGWKKISGVFKARGGEEFVILGNFYGDDLTLIERIPGGRDGGYYYFDDVLIRRARPGERNSQNTKESIKPAPKEVVEERATTEDIEINETVYEVGAVVELDNIFFEFDKAELKPESRKELQELADLLFDHPFMEIEISGHTDNVGKDTYNQKLSEARAKAVVNFLTLEDIDTVRLSFVGYGSTIPIDTNDSPEGQANNRRVEFKIIKN